MDERSSRIFVGLCLLVLVWIGVYWMWEPERDDRPRITFAGQRDPEPRVQEELAVPLPEPTIEQQPAPRVVEPEVTVPKVITDLRATQDPVEVIPPEFTSHTVQEYETMGSIARAVYGASARWDVIARANPRVDPKRLKVGQVLRIPVDPDNIQGKAVTRDHDADAPPARPSKVVEYFVQEGDSLSRISEKFYGSSRHARMIYEYNRDTLSGMDDISIGQLLKLPPLDEAASTGG